MLHVQATETLLPGITDQSFYQEMQRIRDLIDSRANAIERKLDQHAEDDRDLFSAISNRVLIIETQRDNEKNQAIKRGSALALAGAGGMTLAISALRKLLNI